MAKDMVIWPQYSMVKLEYVLIHKDRIILNQTSPTADKVSEQPLLAEGVKEFEFLNSQTLLLWGIRFPNEVRVDFDYQPLTVDIKSTLLGLDNGLREVSTKQPRSVTSQLRRQSSTKRPRPSSPGSPAGSWAGASPVGRRGSSTASHNSGLSPASHRSRLSPASHRSGLSPASHRSGQSTASHRGGPSPASQRGHKTPASLSQEIIDPPSQKDKVSQENSSAPPSQVATYG